MKKLLLLGVLLISGCAGFGGNMKTVDCEAKVKIHTWGGKQVEPVHINAMRSDRFGREFVRVQNRPGYAIFYGHWQPKDTFSDYTCKS